MYITKMRIDQLASVCIIKLEIRVSISPHTHRIKERKKKIYFFMVICWKNVEGIF